MSSTTIRITFEGANPVAPVGRGELPGRSNFFLGDDPAAWRTDVRNFHEVAYESLYNGVDLVYRETSQGLKYDIVVHAGGDARAVSMRYDRVDSLQVTAGALLVRTPAGDLRDSALIGRVAGKEVACAFAVRGPRGYGFDCAPYDRTQTMVIDPLLTYRTAYSTYLGGSTNDVGFSVAVDASNKTFVTGYTDSVNFPHTRGSYNGSEDAFVAKFDASQTGSSSLVWSTYLGGSAKDEGRSIALDGNGNPYVTGFTYSTDFPHTKGVYQGSNKGGADLFATKLNPTSGALTWSTYLGATGNDFGYAIALDSGNRPYLTGITYSGGSKGFPVSRNAFDTTYGTTGSNGNGDAFMSVLTADGSGLAYSTFFGGTGTDVGHSIKVDSSGNAYFTGGTTSTSTTFPVKSAYQTQNNGGEDAFVAKLKPGTSPTADLFFSTFLGGAGTDEGNSIAVDASTGNAYLTGNTSSTSGTPFPTTSGAYDNSQNGGIDAFVSEISNAGTNLLYSTFFGGSQDDMGYSLVLGAAPVVYVSGATASSSSTFPVTPCANSGSLGGTSDAFVARLSLSGGGSADRTFATYLGGSNDEASYSIALEGSSSYATIHATGSTKSADFPTANAYQTGFGGTQDAFVTKLSYLGTPCFPVNVQAMGGKARIYISWSEPASNGGNPVSGYSIYRDNLFLTSVTVTHYLDTVVTPGQTYCYAVSAFNVAGEGPRSSQACATPINGQLNLETGTEWPVTGVGDTLIRGVFTVHLDNNPQLEMIAVGESYGGTPAQTRAEITVWKWTGGSSQLQRLAIRDEADPSAYALGFYGVYAADLDNDGLVNDIVAVGYYSTAPGMSFPMICPYKWDGSNLVLQPACAAWSPPGRPGGGQFRSVYAANLDRVSNMEVIMSGYVVDMQGHINGVVYYFTYAGGSPHIESYYYGLAESVYHSVYAGDVTGDTTPDIVVGGYTASIGGPRSGQVIVFYDYSRWLWVAQSWPGDNGGSDEVFSVYAADLLRDQVVDIMTCGYSHNADPNPMFNKDSGELRIFKYAATPPSLQQERQTQEWTNTLGARCLAVGNLDPIDIVTAGWSATKSGGAAPGSGAQYAELRMWDFTVPDTDPPALVTSKAWNYYVTLPGILGNATANSLAVGDVDADGNVDIVTGGQITQSTRWDAQIMIWKDP